MERSIRYTVSECVYGAGRKRAIGLLPVCRCLDGWLLSYCGCHRQDRAEAPCDTEQQRCRWASGMDRLPKSIEMVSLGSYFFFGTSANCNSTSAWHEKFYTYMYSSQSRFEEVHVNVFDVDVTFLQCRQSADRCELSRLAGRAHCPRFRNIS